MEEKPPVFKSWRSWYVLILAVMLVQVIFYFWLTQQFA